jgi:hypothetical protein
MWGDCPSQNYFSSTRPVAVLNVYLAPPSWCLASAEQAVAAAAALRRSLWAASLAWFLWPMNIGMAIAARMPMMSTTTYRCKTTNTPGLRFRALLLGDGTQQVELARA